MPRAAAAATYYAAREVSRRVLAPLAPPPLALALLSASAASAAALVVRAPADVYKLTQQTAAAPPDGAGDERGRAGGEAAEAAPAQAAALSAIEYVKLGAAAFPACIVADLPPLLLRTFIYSVVRSQLLANALPLPVDEALTVSVACAVALLTTPLDVLFRRCSSREGVSGPQFVSTNTTMPFARSSGVASKRHSKSFVPAVYRSTRFIRITVPFEGVAISRASSFTANCRSGRSMA